MPELRAIVDAEEILLNHLKADTAVTALVPASRITTELPKSFTKQSRIQAFRTGGVPDEDDIPGHLDQPSLQINAFGSTKAQAHAVAAEAIRSVLAAPAATHSGAVVTHARRVLGPTWSPDPPTDTPRYIIGVILWIHPTGS